MEKRLKYLHWVGWTGLRMCSSGQAWKSTRGRRLHTGVGPVSTVMGVREHGARALLVAHLASISTLHFLTVCRTSYCKHLSCAQPVWTLSGGELQEEGMINSRHYHWNLSSCSLLLATVIGSGLGVLPELVQSRWFFRTLAGKAGTAHSLPPELAG